MRLLALGLLACQLLAASNQLTLEQFEAQKEFAIRSQQEHWTHTYDVGQIGRHATGLIDAPSLSNQEPERLGAGELMKPFDLRDFGKPIPKILDQASCGSCVIFSFTSNANWLLSLFEIPGPGESLSAQELMNCGKGDQCNGYWGEGAAEDLVKLGSLVKWSDYPYTARSGKCNSPSSAKRWGTFKSWKTIEGTPESILSALHQGYPVSVGIAADNTFSAYRSGRYTACSSQSINHYVLIESLSCGTSIDASGNCKFDAQGKLPAGVGSYRVRNSWGEDWGDKGYIEMAVTDSRGRNCQALAAGQGNAQIVDPGVPLPDLAPKEFDMEGAQLAIHFTPEKGVKLKTEDAKAILQEGLDMIDAIYK